MNHIISNEIKFGLLKFSLICLPLLAMPQLSQASSEDDLEARFSQPPAEAQPWTFYYWLKGASSSEGITADLEAMADIGLGGAYLMPLIAPDEDPFFDPPVRILSDEYWALATHTLREADRLGLKLGLHVGPGFSLAGGPWIPPELSMQRISWTETFVEGGQAVSRQIEQPRTEAGYYEELGVFALPYPGDAEAGAEFSVPVVTASFSDDDPLGRILDPENAEPVRTNDSATITYTYPKDVLVRTVTVRPHTRHVQGLRLTILASADGKTFREVAQLEPPRHGWQDVGASSVDRFTFAIPETRARIFKFVYDPEGTEPGAEDLDAAKWRPSLRLRGLELSSIPRLHQFEGKSAAAWRVAPWTDAEQIPEDRSIPREAVIDLSSNINASGQLEWEAPAGNWLILRMGTTSTGATNYTGGAGEGLEADKLNPEAIRLQFESWFLEHRRQAGAELFDRVVSIFHSDSWEAESQNWSPLLPAEFAQRRRYSLKPFLPVYAGLPIEGIERSEQFLHDLRRTIAELVNETYFGTLRDLAHEVGCRFSSESVAPTFVSDNLRHHGTIDLPMGEFWLKSPTHDKPFDMRDAVSGAHIYGKPIIQAEAFTQLRILWDEAPHNLKALGDLHFALGVNRMVFHVFMQTPWTDREPGVSLNGVGLFFQRGQTWWEKSRAWMEYLSRAQALLQTGQPVVDVAVFAGEELPSRSLLPDRLVKPLPGLFGAERVAAEAQRLANRGIPLQEAPKGVMNTANSTHLADWTNPLRGYTYDSLNHDVLMNHATARDGVLELDGGMRYRVLVVPGSRRLNPEGGQRMSPEFAQRLLDFAEAGLPVILEEVPGKPLGGAPDEDLDVVLGDLLGHSNVHIGPWLDPHLARLGIARDLRALDATTGQPAADLAWHHRRTGEASLYFLSNQQDRTRDLKLSLRQRGRLPELWDPVTGKRRALTRWQTENGRTGFSIRLAPAESVFLVFRKPTEATTREGAPNIVETVPHQRLDQWTLRIPTREDPLDFKRGPQSWSLQEEPEVRFFSGTGTYTTTFAFDPAVSKGPVWLSLGTVRDIAEVWLNGRRAGILWTAPWRVDISDLVQSGENTLRIEVTNTWANQVIRDEARAPEGKELWTNAPFRLEGSPLLDAGLLGPVLISCEVPGHEPSPPVIPFPEDIMENAREVAPEVMEQVYETVKTPYKYGVVLKGEEGELVDCPNIFRHKGKWYMMFVGNKNGVGYKTYLAESDDLLNWRRMGTILPFPDSGWDRWQGDAGVSLIDTEWGGSYELEQYEGRYWASYIGGSLQGYEPDPLSAGLIWTEDPASAEPWSRFEGNPILTPNHPYARAFERKTVYKSHIIHDPEERLGWPFVMYYNGKEEGGGGHEAIMMAVSRDMRTWHRFGDREILYNGENSRWAITGDPQITRIGDLWVMFYFGAFWKPDAFDTFAVSHDMVNWTKWDGPDLVAPSEPYDEQFAHKPWVVKHKGVVYHYYCAVGEEGRVIALATSEDLTSATAKEDK